MIVKAKSQSRKAMRVVGAVMTPSRKELVVAATKQIVILDTATLQARCCRCRYCTEACLHPPLCAPMVVWWWRRRRWWRRQCCACVRVRACVCRCVRALCAFAIACCRCASNHPARQPNNNKKHALQELRVLEERVTNVSWSSANICPWTAVIYGVPSVWGGHQCQHLIYAQERDRLLE